MIKNNFKIVNLVTLITTAFVSTTCIDEYWPELGTRYDKALVVDGMITDREGPYTVNLSLSSTVDEPVFIPLTGAEVIISDDFGNEELIAETEMGVYQSSPNGIKGEVGRSYKISIRTSDEKTYESEYEKLSLSTAIDSVYGKIEYQQSSNSEYETEGMQFYIDTYRAEQDTNYYLWRLESTFMFNANHFIRYYFDGQFHRFKPIDSLYTCWNTSSAKQIYTYSTVHLNEPVIKGLPLNYVSTNTKMLSIRYSLLVKQLSISQEAYSFWKSLENLNAESGSLFTKQPYQVRGNVKNVNDEDEPVLGYFIVAGISEKRVFVDRPNELDFFYQDECNLITDDLTTMLWLLHDYWPLKLTGKVTEFGFVPALTADEACIDCTQEYYGSTIMEPSFWVE